MGLGSVLDYLNPWGSFWKSVWNTATPEAIENQISESTNWLEAQMRDCSKCGERHHVRAHHDCAPKVRRRLVNDDARVDCQHCGKRYHLEGRHFCAPENDATQSQSSDNSDRFERQFQGQMS